MPARVSTVRGREFGAAVRAVVDATGLSHRAISELLGWDPQKISDLLTGKGGVNETDFARLLGLCQVPEEEYDHLMALLKVTREKGWWQFHGRDLPVQLRTLFEHEDVTKEIISWHLALVPGLLQTPDYMRALMKVWPTIKKPEQVEQRVKVRVERQRVLDARRTFIFYVHEQALRLPVGGDVVWRDQLHHLLRMSVRPYISLRVVPTAIGAHAGTMGEFKLMKFEKLEPVVYLETNNSCIFLEDKATLDLYTGILKSLDAAALDEEQSRRLITDIVS
ncbi:helix-turn-helix domain-containing protein [Lentzea kentuckyensis]|uniref:helix-turn-helix domain-containing protein n=1 Tax=Lentzea kentuckyensis TaxID=360086 RepID=UPI0013027FD6|nr:helix-turn-helix transcriptional regulator [Lentzea kentuckyensis]